MEDEPNAPKASWTGLWCTSAFLMLLILYPLSVGPVAWLAKKGFLPADLEQHLAVRILYGPVIWLYENCEWYNGAHSWYLSLWGV